MGRLPRWLNSRFKRPDVEQVFGTAESPPLSYIERADVDDRFKGSLARHTPILIFGPSGTGKTSLYGQHLKSHDYILVTCQSNLDTRQYSRRILASYQDAVEKARVYRSQSSGHGQVGLAATRLGIGRSDEDITLSEITAAPIESVDDLANVLLKHGPKPIVFEEYQRVGPSTATELGDIVKTLGGYRIKCIVVAAWRENRLPPDSFLDTRLTQIDTGKWSDEDMLRAANKGEEVLGINFTDEFKVSAIAHSLGTITVLQEICYEELSNRSRGLQNNIGDAESARRIASNLLSQKSRRFWGYLLAISQGYERSRNYAAMLEGILLHDVQGLRVGLRIDQIADKMNDIRGRRGLDSVSDKSLQVTFEKFVQIQAHQGIPVELFDYSADGHRIRVVDSVFLAWRNSISDSEIMSNALSWYS